MTILKKLMAAVNKDLEDAGLFLLCKFNAVKNLIRFFHAGQLADTAPMLNDDQPSLDLTFCGTFVIMDFVVEELGEMAEPVEGARLLSEYMGLNLYRGFESRSLRHTCACSSVG